MSTFTQPLEQRVAAAVDTLAAQVQGAGAVQDTDNLVVLSIDTSSSMTEQAAATVENIVHKLLSKANFTLVNVVFNDGGVVAFDGRVAEQHLEITENTSFGTRADDVVAFAEGRGTLKNAIGEDVQVDNPETTVHVLVTDTQMPNPGITQPKNVVLVSTVDKELEQSWVAEFEQAGGLTVNAAEATQTKETAKTTLKKPAVEADNSKNM